ncbi:MAG: hypothetical protein ACT4P4_21675 [Betaproteobacteria bacterium]
MIDGRDRIAFPGMVNAHSHSPLSFCKGVYDKVNHRAAMLNALEMIRTGTTAVIDHFPEQGFGLDDVAAVVEGYRAAGVRAHIALRIFDGDRRRAPIWRRYAARRSSASTARAA